MAVITKRKNVSKSKSKSNSKTRKQFKSIRKNGMRTRKMRGGMKVKPNPAKVNSTLKTPGIKWKKPSIFSSIKNKLGLNKYKTPAQVMNQIIKQQPYKLSNAQKKNYNIAG